MKKIKLLIIILICIMTAFFAGCGRDTTINEIYNVSYSGSITIEDLEDAVQAVIKTSTDSVVGVSNYAYSFGGTDLQSTGSAIIYDAYAHLKSGNIVKASETIDDASTVDFYEYFLITNEHVIADAYAIKVNFDDDSEDATIIYENKEKDLAIISFESNFYFPVLEFGESEDLKAGTFVVSIGSPNGLEYMDTATFGIISYVKRYIIERYGIKKITNEYIQHDCALSPGNSGGPLLSLNGKVIGINTIKIVDSETEGMGFAIPSNVVKEFIRKYEETQSEAD